MGWRRMRSNSWAAADVAVDTDFISNDIDRTKYKSKCVIPHPYAVHRISYSDHIRTKSLAEEEQFCSSSTSTRHRICPFTQASVISFISTFVHSQHLYSTSSKALPAQTNINIVKSQATVNKMACGEMSQEISLRTETPFIIPSLVFIFLIAHLPRTSR